MLRFCIYYLTVSLHIFECILKLLLRGIEPTVTQVQGCDITTTLKGLLLEVLCHVHITPLSAFLGLRDFFYTSVYGRLSPFILGHKESGLNSEMNKTQDRLHIHFQDIGSLIRPQQPSFSAFSPFTRIIYLLFSVVNTFYSKNTLVKLTLFCYSRYVNSIPADSDTNPYYEETNTPASSMRGVMPQSLNGAQCGNLLFQCRPGVLMMVILSEWHCNLLAMASQCALHCNAKQKFLTYFHAKNLVDILLVDNVDFSHVKKLEGCKP